MRSEERRAGRRETEFLRLVLTEPEPTKKPSPGLWGRLSAVLLGIWAFVAWTTAFVLLIFFIGMAVDAAFWLVEWVTSWADPGRR